MENELLVKLGALDNSWIRINPTSLDDAIFQAEMSKSLEPLAIFTVISDSDNVIINTIPLKIYHLGVWYSPEENS